MNELDHVIQRDPDDKLDTVLRAELRWEASAELTSRLLALVPGAPVLSHSVVQPAVVRPRPRPQPWYTWLVMVLTAMAIGLSFAVAWQFYSAVGAELGLAAMWSQLQAAPAIGLQRLYETFPVTRYAVALLIGIRDQLHWLLLAAVLWLALDGWSPGFALRRQQPTT